jgi:hemerythrin superfamily protein
MSTTSAMNDVVALLESQHRAVEALFGQYSSSSGRNSQLVEEVISTLVVHSVAEEQHVYPVVRKKLDNGDAAADRAYHEQAEAEALMARIDDLAPNDPELRPSMLRLEAAIRAHVTYEETNLLPRLRAALTRAESADLAGKVTRAEQHAPTHPHPHAPDSPIGHKLTGPIAAALDRLRDHHH